MKKSLTLIFLLCSIVSFAQNTTGTINDARDGKVYKTVVIGSQTWMSENLNVSTFRNGDVIPEAKTEEEWIKAGEEGKPAWCYYDNNQVNGTKYGKLYNWYAVNDPRGLAPAGFHIPTDAEWGVLSDFLGGENTAGQKMKNTSGWVRNGNGTNTSGFSGIPGGDRERFGYFFSIGSYGYWWSASEGNAWVAVYRNLFHYHSSLDRNGFEKENGLSVRCIKN